MKRYMIVIFLVLSLSVWGCAGLSDTQQRSMTGGLIGAGAGAAIGAISGNAGWGAVIGAAPGSGQGPCPGSPTRRSAWNAQGGRTG